MVTQRNRPVEKILSRLERVKKATHGWTARCPGHDDKRRSLSINEGDDDRALIKCFAGCKTPNVLAAIGLQMRDLFMQKKSYRASSKSLTLADLARDKGLPEEFLKEAGIAPVMDIYGRDVLRIAYRKEDGSLAPRHRIRKALQAKHGSLWTKGGGAIVPYGLWKLPEAKKKGFLVLVEGESDCWTLWFNEYPALGIPGADMAKTLQTNYLKDISRIYVFREPDQGGDAFIEGVAQRLKEIGWGGQAFELKLEGVKDPNELHKRDPSAFKETFQKAMDSSPPLPEPPTKERQAGIGSGSNLPSIWAQEGDLKKVTSQAWAALHAANNPEKWFRCGGVAMRIEHDDDERPVMRELFLDRLRHILARVADWWKFNKNGDVEAAPPPVMVVKDMLATPDIPLPILSRIVEAPVFSSSGELQTRPGYHLSSRTYYAPAGGFSVPAVAEVISASDLARARSIIAELLCDFPFVGDAERAHAVALQILPHARGLIDGATPLHLIEAPAPGTGKTLLTDVLTYPASGHPVTTLTEGRDEDEWRKRLTSKLLCCPPIIMLDNLRRRLDSAALSAAITSPAWEDRILGQSKVVSLPVECAWIATGNNPSLSNEMARRTIRIRLDAKQDRPWLRQMFRHPNLRDWVKENRPQLVWATLVLIKA